MDTTKLMKLLALGGSDNDREALSALRSARRLLAGAGLDFVDVASLIQEALEGSEHENEERRLAADIEALRGQLRAARAELRRFRAAARPTESGERHNGLEAPRARRTDSDRLSVEWELRQRLTALEEENLALRRQKQTLEEEITEWQGAYAAMDSTLRESTTERRQLRIKMRRREQELNRFARQVQDALRTTSLYL